MVDAIKQNYPQREIADASFQYQAEVEDGKRIIVGVNGYTEGGEDVTPILRIDPDLERKQVGRLQAVKAARDPEVVEAALSTLREVAAGDGNLMGPLLECARANVSEGEIVGSLQRLFGTYTETPVF